MKFNQLLTPTPALIPSPCLDETPLLSIIPHLMFSLLSVCGPLGLIGCMPKYGHEVINRNMAT